MASTFKFNKWLFLAGTSVAAALSYGTYALTSNSHHQSQLNVPSNALLNGLGTSEELPEVTEEQKVSEGKPEETSDQESPSTEATNPANGNVPVVQNDNVANGKGQPNKGSDVQNVQDKDYLKSIGKHSMGGKYRDSMVLAPEGSEIGKKRQNKMVEKYTRGEKVYTGGSGFISSETLRTEPTGRGAHDFCKTALSYSEGTTFGRRGISKRYLDFVGDICSKDGVNKPSGWWG